MKDPEAEEVEGAISLAKAAELAGQSRYAFALLLKAKPPMIEITGWYSKRVETR